MLEKSIITYLLTHTTIIIVKHLIPVSYTHLDVYKRQAYANEVLDDVAEQLAQLLSELKTEKNSFKNMGIDRCV